MSRFSLVLVLVVYFPLEFVNSQYFCSDAYCETYRQQKQCPNMALGCKVQNETHNGEIFPAAEPCNCCNICLEHIKEGDYCTIGSMDAAPPVYACGPGLICTLETDSGDHVCKKMTDTPCFKEQIKFDKKQKANLTGKYMERPKCDGDGNYQPIKCNIGQSCFCINEGGDRIFGEAPYSLENELTMKCECSRLNDKLSKLINSRYPVITARCLEDGSYDPLQCMGEICLCVDGYTGYSATDTYNVTEVGFKNLPCYNGNIHRSWIYLHNCEQTQHALIEDIQTSEAEGFIVIFPKGEFCQPDGWYLPVQQNATHKYCVDKYGNDMKDYVVSKEVGGGDMNCLCARTVSVIPEKKDIYVPECCPNGNFKKVQCRSEQCYCVDKNGIQTTKEVDEAKVSSLSCYNKGNYCK